MTHLSAPLLDRPQTPQAVHQLNAQEARKLVGNIQIPPQPEVVRALIIERNSDDPDLQKIVRLISNDVGLSAAMMKTVNSSFYGLRTKVTSIQQAVAMLGMKNVGSLVMGLALRNSMPTPGMERYWETTGRVAQLAYMLARHLGLRIAEEAHLYALFHDCAMPLLLQRIPSYRDTLNQIAATGWIDITELEDARHDTNHAVVGGLLASNWGLPVNIHDAIQWHHDATIFINDEVSSEVLTLIALGHVAEKIEESLSKRLNDCAWEEFGASSLYHLMLKESELQEFIDAAKEQFGVSDY